MVDPLSGNDSSLRLLVRDRRPHSPLCCEAKKSGSQGVDGSKNDTGLRVRPTCEGRASMSEYQTYAIKTRAVTWKLDN